MYVQTCEKVDVIIRLENYSPSDVSSLIMLSEEKKADKSSADEASKAK